MRKLQSEEMSHALAGAYIQLREILYVVLRLLRPARLDKRGHANGYAGSHSQGAPGVEKVHTAHRERRFVPPSVPHELPRLQGPARHTS